MLTWSEGISPGNLEMALQRRNILVAGLAALARPALAQPSGRPIRLVVAFAPGGATDVTARVLAERLQDQLGQPVVVENRAGAAGIIGTEAAARSAPDGSTLLMGTISTHAMNVPLYGKRLGYDPVKDFAPVSRVATGPNLLVVHPSLPERSVEELVRLAKARPGQLAYGSGGNGTSSHLAGELFKSLAGVDLLHVPFRSTAPAATALAAGQVQVMFDTIISALPMAREGQVRALAVTAPQRLPSLPDLPAVAETLPGFEMGIWIGLFAPAGTPPPVIERIDAATRAALATPALKARLEGIGAQPFPAGPAEFAAFLQAEIARWSRVVQAAGITAD
ncbi:MAG: tripartite tricarboxylate transporter substrate binding protein [Acetobacteraceae bacterium]|nr:tripartite tricarboxylate transporter substrate binding protein [Acetobacteraceae bacterium]